VSKLRGCEIGRELVLDGLSKLCQVRLGPDSFPDRSRWLPIPRDGGGNGEMVGITISASVYSAIDRARRHALSTECQVDCCLPVLMSVSGGARHGQQSELKVLDDGEQRLCGGNPLISIAMYRRPEGMMQIEVSQDDDLVVDGQRGHGLSQVVQGVGP